VDHNRQRGGQRVPAARTRARWALLLALAAPGLAAAGCGNRGSNDRPVVDDAHSASAARVDDTSAQGNVPMTDTQRDIELIRQHYSKQLQLAPGDLKVRIDEGAKVPGVTLFSVVANPAKAGRHIQRGGIVEGGAIYIEGEAMQRVARAWQYGPRRTVSAVQFARVMSQLHNTRHESSTILDADTLDVFKSIAYPSEAAAAKLPAETTVDGLPAVEYCLQSESRSIPFTVVTAIVKPDFQVELREQRIMKE
jgi:hypothetical protein